MDIDVRNLCKNYGQRSALRGIDLQISAGMFGLLGPNGAGKTTLMRILATLLPPTSGEVTIGGIGHKDRQAIRAILGYLPQEFAFYPQLSVYEAMDYLAILAGLEDRKRRQIQIGELLEKVNLWEHRKVKTRALSGGMKRRLGIAQALINDPQVLIVDEPTAGLDPEERVRFRNLLSDFAVHRTVILSTHIVGDIEFACENLAVLNQGRLIYDGKVKDLLIKAQDYIWTVKVDRMEMNHIRSTFKVISYVTDDEGVSFRLLSKEQPLTGAVHAKPTVEDAYMGLMGGVIA